MVKFKKILFGALAVYAGVRVNECGTYWYHEKYGRDKIVERHIDSVFTSQYNSQARALGITSLTVAPFYYGGHELYEDYSPWVLFSHARRQALTNEKGEILFFSAEFSSKRNSILTLSEEKRIEEVIRHEATHSVVTRICPNPRSANPGETLIHEGFAFLMENGTGNIDCSGGAGMVPKMGRIPEYTRAACFVEPIWKSFGLAGICYAIAHPPREENNLLLWREQIMESLREHR